MKCHHLDVNAQGQCLLLKWPVLTTTWQAKLLKDEHPWEVLSDIIDKNSCLSSTVCWKSQPDKSKALALCCFTALSDGNRGLKASTGSKAHLLYWSYVFSLSLLRYFLHLSKHLKLAYTQQVLFGGEFKQREKSTLPEKLWRKNSAVVSKVVTGEKTVQ